MKRFITLFLMLVGLFKLSAADSTIGNLTPITDVPDAYRMPWENPGILDYYITFANLTNQILTGIASKAYAQGLTNGFVDASVTNGLAPVAYVTAATNGFVYASVTNGLAPVAYVTAATNGFITSASLSGYAPLAGTNLFTRTNTFEADALGTTITPIMWLTNGTAAALGAQQASPALMLGGQGWRSGNSTTMPVQMGMYVLPVQGSSANPTEALHFVQSVSNSAPSSIANLDSTGLLTTSGGLACSSGNINSAGALAASTFMRVGISSYYSWNTRSLMFSPGDGDIQLVNSGSTAFSRLYLGPTTSNWPAIKVESSTNNPSISFRTGNDSNYVSIVASNITATATMKATNGFVLQLKPSFTTNFTCTTNLQVYLCNGTNQIVTLPDAASVSGIVYRIASTNGWARVVVTNATGTQTIRDGSSLSYTLIGIGNPSFISDGSHWWPASRIKSIMANAQFSTSTNIPLTLANTAYPVTYNSTDYNNSQGISLVAGTNGLLSKIRIVNPGQYEFSPSVVQSFNGNDTIRVWFRSNNTNILNSCTPSKGQNGSIRVITIPFIVAVTEQTDYELWAESDSAGEELLAQAASGNYPAAPSVICPVKKISDSYP